jgi:hypothetical protein
MKMLPQPWSAAMEATMFTGWIYDHLKPHAPALKVAIITISRSGFRGFANSKYERSATFRSNTAVMLNQSAESFRFIDLPLLFTPIPAPCQRLPWKATSITQVPQ